MPRRGNRIVFVAVLVVAVVAVGGLGFLLTSAPIAPTPIFDTGNAATDGGARTSIWSGAYNSVYERWLPSDPNVDHDITTVKAWLYRPSNYNGAGSFFVSVSGGGIDESKCPNQPNGDFLGCAVEYPATYIPVDNPSQVTFDVSGQGWIRHASSVATQFSIYESGVHTGIMWLWAESSSQGTGHCAEHAGTCYVLKVGSASYYDTTTTIYETIAAPTPPITVDFTSSSSGLTASFVSTVAGGNPPYTYQWDFGDQRGSTAANPSHTYVLAGTYTVVLTAGDGFHSGSVSHSITVSSGTYTPMSVDFTFTVDADGVTTHFTSSVSHGLPPYSYSWDFGDGSAKSAEQNPVHVYGSSGTFTVKLSVTDTKPATVTATHTVSASQQTPPPSASFSYTAKYLYVTFVGSASGGTSPYVYSWDFGDGATASASSTSHGYMAAGSYNVVFTVTDSKGLTGSQTRAVSVSAPPPEPTPLTSVDFTDENIGNSTVSFTSTVKGGNGSLSYSWDFGDSGSSTSGNPSYQYAAPGTYTVKLVVTDSSGASMTATHSVTATAAPSAPLPWVQIIGIALAGSGAVFAAFMLEYKKLRKIQYVFGVVLLIALGAVLIAGVL